MFKFLEIKWIICTWLFCIFALNPPNPIISPNYNITPSLHLIPNPRTVQAKNSEFRHSGSCPCSYILSHSYKVRISDRRRGCISDARAIFPPPNSPFSASILYSCPISLQLFFRSARVECRGEKFVKDRDSLMIRKKMSAYTPL